MSEDPGNRARSKGLAGELLPEVTRDETAESWGEPAEDRDEKLRREVPPHHG